MNFNEVIVLDTSMLIYDPLIIFSFNNAMVIIPMVALEELDKAKLEKTEAGYNARLAIKFIEQISKIGSLVEGVVVSEANAGFMTKFTKTFTSLIKVVAHASKLDAVLFDFYLDNNDNKILSLCCNLQREMGHVVKLVTLDVNLRIKARILQIDVVDFANHLVDQIGIKGYREEALCSMDLRFLTPDNLTQHFDLGNVQNNEYLVVKSSDNPSSYRIFRYRQSEGFVEVGRTPHLWGFAGRNIAQELALNLLLDDEIPLVFLIGPAGTGKTLLTLLAGLHKVVAQRRYDKFFIARPLVSLGADIGFVPGDLQEKLYHWMHPFYDNLDYIFREIDRRGEIFDMPRFDERRANHSGGRRSDKKQYYSDEALSFAASVHEMVNGLQKRGLLSLEAITHMRGRTLPNQFMFIDEVQNLTPQEVKTIVTRAGTGTKIILAGDPYQVDSSSMDFYNNGLMATLLRLRGESLVGHLSLDISERSALASLAIRKL